MSTWLSWLRTRPCYRWSRVRSPPVQLFFLLFFFVFIVSPLDFCFAFHLKMFFGNFLGFLKFVNLNLIKSGFLVNQLRSTKMIRPGGFLVDLNFGGGVKNGPKLCTPCISAISGPKFTKFEMCVSFFWPIFTKFEMCV